MQAAPGAPARRVPPIQDLRGAAAAARRRVPPGPLVERSASAGRAGRAPRAGGA
jgi:hypothetical protein